MDMSPSAAILPEIRMEDINDNVDYCIFTGFDDNLPEIYDPNQFQEKAFKDDDEFASTDQIMMAIMEDNENALGMTPQLLECGVERVNSQMSESVTAVESSLKSRTPTTTSSSDFVNSNYELIPSPTSFNFASMILEETMIDSGHNSNGSDPVTTKCSESNKRSRSMVRSHAQTQDHILSERKRREKLSQLFIALAAMVPHLKKTDKASILSGAIEHLKQLKEKDASLRDHVNNKKRIQTGTKSLSSTSSASLDTSTFVGNIDVKYEGRCILIRINIDNIRKGAIINLLHGIEMDGLVITQSCFFPFGDSVFAITIVATMDEEFSLTANELVANLHALINQF